MPYVTVELTGREREMAMGLTAGEARSLLVSVSPDDPRPSVVNPDLAKGQVRRILWGAVDGVGDGDVVGYPLARNILRECLVLDAVDDADGDGLDGWE